MSILSAAERADLIAVAEGQMVDHCVITPPGGGGGAGNLNPATLSYDNPPPAGAPVYDDICEVQDQLQAGDNLSGGQAVTEQARVIKVRLTGSEGVRPGHLLKLTTTADPGMLHRRFRVDAISAATHATSRKLRCREITGPAV